MSFSFWAPNQIFLWLFLVASVNRSPFYWAFFSCSREWSWTPDLLASIKCFDPDISPSDSVFMGRFRPCSLYDVMNLEKGGGKWWRILEKKENKRNIVFLLPLGSLLTFPSPLTQPCKLSFTQTHSSCMWSQILGRMRFNIQHIHRILRELKGSMANLTRNLALIRKDEGKDEEWKREDTVTEDLPSMFETMGSIPRTTKPEQIQPQEVLSKVLPPLQLFLDWTERLDNSLLPVGCSGKEYHSTKFSFFFFLAPNFLKGHAWSKLELHRGERQNSSSTPKKMTEQYI